MGWLGTIIGLIIIGLIAGFIARAVVPGRQHMSILSTIVLGVIGSFVGGFLGRLIHHGGSFIQPSSWFGSIVGAIIVLLLYMRFGNRSRA